MSSWWPEGYCFRYPFRCADPYDGPPHYPFVPVIVLADAFMAGGAGTKRANFWRRVRANAVLQWESAGFEITVREDVDPTFFRKGRITIDVEPTQDGTRGQADFGARPPVDGVPEQPLPGAGWARVDDDWFETQFQARTPGGLLKVLAHEIGHTFGFGHHDDRTGVMNTYATGSVNDAERDAARSFWFPKG